MSTETDLCNDALSQLGAATITSLGDGSINSNHCQRFYPQLRDARLASHHWNFALTWVQLSPDVTGPIAGFNFAYTLPADCLKVVNYGGALPSSPPLIMTYNSPYTRILVQYKIEGRKLVSNDGTAYIQYLRRITNPDEWSPLFYQGVSSALASKLAMAIPKDEKKAIALMQMAEMTFATAMAVDGQENSIEPYIVDDLIWGR